MRRIMATATLLFVVPVVTHPLVGRAAPNSATSVAASVTNQELTDAMIQARGGDAETVSVGRVIEHPALDDDGRIAGIDFQTFVPR